MNNVILIGMMGCGKTTVGKLLAEKLGRELADTDVLIEEREGRTIPEIFSAEGEAYFRELELAVCKKLARRNDLVIACGGGLPLREEAIHLLKDSGTVFWLNRDPGRTYDSLDTASRPLAQAGREDFIARYDQRAPIYRRWAKHTIANPPSVKSAAVAIHAILQYEEENPS